MEEEPLSEGAPETAAGLRALGEADRDVMEKATRAFVSYVRGYKEHQVPARDHLTHLPSGALCRVHGRCRMHGRFLPPAGAWCNATSLRLICGKPSLACLVCSKRS